MPALFIYLIKANIVLALFYLAYRFGLRRLTFYTLNRYFLLSGIACSALFPLVNFRELFQSQVQQVATNNTAYYGIDWNALQQYPTSSEVFSLWNILQYIFWSGVAVMFIRFVIQLISLLRIHLQSSAGKINQEKVHIISAGLNPFSFFKSIYINPDLHSPEEINAILSHEKIHTKQWHSIDVLAGELNQIFYWFNPGAWLMKVAIGENLEFITDRALLRSGMNAKKYQYSLLKTMTGLQGSQLANNFNLSHLKNRIMMMNKQKSSGYHLFRYLLLVPVVAIVAISITASRGQEIKKGKTVPITLKTDTLKVLKKIPENQHFNKKGYVIRVKESSGESTVLSKDGVILGPYYLYSFSRKELADFNHLYGSKATYEQIQQFKNRATFIKDHPEIHRYFWKSDHTIWVKTEKGGKRTYNMNKATDKKALIKKYGAIPPVFNPKADHGNEMKSKDTIPKHIPADFKAFLKRNPSVKRITWTKEKGYQKAVIAIVHLTSGKTERYHLDNKKEMKKAKEKYGKLPAPPPPPPPLPQGPKVIYTPPKIKDTSIHQGTVSNSYYTGLAYKALKKGKFQTAKTYAGKALKKNPNNKTAQQILLYIQKMKTYQQNWEAYKKKHQRNDAPKVKVKFTPPTIIRDSTIQTPKYTQSKNDSLPKNVLYIINDKEVKKKDSKNLNPGNIKSIYIFKDKKATEKYGEKGKNGVIKIYTKDYVKKHPEALSRHTSTPKTKVSYTPAYTLLRQHAYQNNDSIASHGLANDAGLYIVDGKIRKSIRNADPDSIASITVLKGKSATTIYGEKGRNGVIEIYTKSYVNKHPEQHKNNKLTRAYNRPKSTPIILDGKSPARNPLYIVNNKQVDSNYVHKYLDPDDIYSMSVLKDKSAIKSYGKKGKNGAIQIFTKDFIKQHPEAVKKE